MATALLAGEPSSAIRLSRRVVLRRLLAMLMIFLIDWTSSGYALYGLCLVRNESWVGTHDEPNPRRTFSQIARLEEDGSVEVGERVFFEDYDQDTGPLLAKGKRKRRNS